MSQVAKQSLKFPKVLLIYPPLAKEIGLHESLLLTQLNHLIEIGQAYPDKHLRDERYWTYQSVSDLQAQFPFMGRGTIQRAIEALIDRGLIDATDQYNQRKSDRTRWFAINYEACNALESFGGEVTESVPERYESFQDGTQSFQSGTGPYRSGTTLPDTTPDTTPETTEDSFPLQSPKGDGKILRFPEAPPLQEEVVQEPVTPEGDTEKTPPPTPSPRDLERAEQRMLDMRRSVDSQSSRRPRRGDAWADEAPERLAKIERVIWACWREKNPNKATQRDLKLIRSSVAPDEVARFMAQTDAYLSLGFGDPEYMKSLRTWLTDWRDWVRPEKAPRAKATDAPSIYQEIELMKKITGRAVGA